MPGKVYNPPPGGQGSHEQIKMLHDYMKGKFIHIPCPFRLDGQDNVTNIWSFVWSGSYGNSFEVRRNLDMVERKRFAVHPTADNDDPEWRQ